MPHRPVEAASGGSSAPQARSWPWAVAAGILCPCHSVPLALALAAIGPLAAFRNVLAGAIVLAFVVLLAAARDLAGSFLHCAELVRHSGLTLHDAGARPRAALDKVAG